MSRPPLDPRVAAQIIHPSGPVYAEIEAQWAAHTAAAAASAAAASAAGSPARPQWQQQSLQPQQPPRPDPQARSRSPVGRGSVAEAEASSANARASSPGGPTGWYYNWPRQMHELWQGSSGPALTPVPPTPLADAFLAAAGGLEERLQEPRAGTGSGAQAASASPAQAGTGSGAQPASASPAQAESDTAALHEIIGLLWRGHIPQRVLRAGGTVHVVAEEVGGRERMERLLELAIDRRRPGVDAHQEKRWRAGKDPLPEQRVVLDEKEVELCMNDWKEDFLANELNDQEGLTELIALGAIEEERRRVEAAWMELLAQRLQRVLFMYRTAGTLEQIWEGIVSLVRHCEAEDEGALGRPRLSRPPPS